MNEPTQALTPFGDYNVVPTGQDMAVVERATQEVQAALVIAKRFPRDEIGARAKILQACKRKGLAEVSEYEYSRGGQTITGPTIDLLRAIAKRWGNLLFGWAEVDRVEDKSFIRAWAWDTESNSRAERTFVVKHWRDRKGGEGYVLKDERDIYELLANQAARRVRACLEEVIDADIIEDAVTECRKTMKEGDTQPMVTKVVAMINSFAPFGVTQGMIESKLQKKAEAFNDNNLATLRRIYKSLKDGVGQPEQFFAPPSAENRAEVITIPGAPIPFTPATEPQPEKPPTVSTTCAIASSPNKELADLVTGGGYSFDHFLAWVRKENWPELNADDLQSFEDVPVAVTKRLLRAKLGLTAGLEKAKRGEL